MKFKVELRRRVLPPGHVGPPPERCMVERSEYVIEAPNEADVRKQFETAKARGFPHLKGRKIHSITAETK